MDKKGQEGTQFTEFALVCVFLSLVSFKISLAAVSHRMCLGDPLPGPKDGEFFGLEVETFVGTSRELIVS